MRRTVKAWGVFGWSGLDCGPTDRLAVYGTRRQAHKTACSIDTVRPVTITFDDGKRRTTPRGARKANRE